MSLVDNGVRNSMLTIFLECNTKSISKNKNSETMIYFLKEKNVNLLKKPLPCHHS